MAEMFCWTCRSFTPEGLPRAVPVSEAEISRHGKHWGHDIHMLNLPKKQNKGNEAWRELNAKRS